MRWMRASTYSSNGRAASRGSTMAKSGRNSLSWNDDTRYALGLYRMFGRNLGIWPLKCHDFSSRIRFFVALILLLIVNYNIIGEFASGCISIFDVVDFIGLLAANTVSILNILMIRLHEKKMFHIVESAVKDWSMIRCEESREIMRGYAHLGRFVLKLTNLFTALIIIGALPTIRPTTNLQTNNDSNVALKNLPIGTGCSMVDVPNALYLAFWLFQYLQLIFVCYCDFGCDCLFFGISMHLLAQFEILKINVARLGEDNGISEINVKEKFFILVERHNHLTGVINLVEDIFHVIILGQLAASGLHITLLGMQILFALRDHFYMVLIHTPMGISVLLLQLWMYSYVGDYLASQAKDIRDAAYNCSWYNFSPSFGKDVLFVIMRSNGNFQLTAGKVFHINLEAFTRIVKTMMSFFSVVKIIVIG